MDDALGMRRRERVGDVDRVAQGFVDRQRAARQPGRERLAVEELQHEERHLASVHLRRAQVVHRTNVGMREPGDRARFALESFTAARREVELGREHFDGDEPIQASVAGAIDLAHAAGTEWFEDLERGEPGARLEPRQLEKGSVVANGTGRRVLQEAAGPFVRRKEGLDLGADRRIVDALAQEGRALARRAIQGGFEQRPQRIPARSRDHAGQPSHPGVSHAGTSLISQLSQRRRVRAADVTQQSRTRHNSTIPTIWCIGCRKAAHNAGSRTHAGGPHGLSAEPPQGHRRTVTFP